MCQLCKAESSSGMISLSILTDFDIVASRYIHAARSTQCCHERSKECFAYVHRSLKPILDITTFPSMVKRMLRQLRHRSRAASPTPTVTAQPRLTILQRTFQFLPADHDPKSKTLRRCTPCSLYKTYGYLHFIPSLGLEPSAFTSSGQAVHEVRAIRLSHGRSRLREGKPQHFEMLSVLREVTPLSNRDPNGIT